MTGREKVGVVILAAGASSRLGRPKQLIAFKGRPLLQHVIDCCQDYDFCSKVLVLGPHAEEIKAHLSLKGFTVVLNGEWEDGMGKSLQTGVAHALSTAPDMRHLLVLLSDQPYVSSTLISTLLETHLSGTALVTACEYSGATGVPAIFSRALFDTLMSIEGDKGAKGLITSNKTNKVPFPKGITDIDTEKDLAALDKISRREP